MKKLLSIMMLCILLLCALALPVAAAGSASMSLSPSSGTLHRGDSFTVTVTLSNTQSVGRGALVLSYDASVFEFVGGSCNVSGTTLAEVSASKNGGIFALEKDKVVSGTIFTINMKVKSTAAFGTYTLSGTASMEIPCSVSGTSVTVACKHTFGAYSKVNDTTHQRTCSICKHVETTDHKWDAGTVIQPATCKDPGTKKLTCTDCGANKNVEIPVNSDHKYSDWKYLDETGHRGTCTVCGDTIGVAHKWELVKVTKEATCTAKGTQIVKCPTCDHEATHEIPVADHKYGKFEKVDDKTHRHTCSVCNHTETANHAFTDQYGHDANGHYLICNDCGIGQTPQNHVPGPAATDDTPQLCTVCKRVLQAALNHVHSYLTKWASDANGHWHACEFCEDRKDQQPHSYENACDDSCNTCGYIREPVHNFSDKLASDASGHYYPCLSCDAKKDSAAHIPGSEATISSAQTCTVCNYELAPRLSHAHQFTAESGMHYHTCACGETSEAAYNDSCPICAADPMKRLDNIPWPILCLLETVLLAVAVVILLLRRRR